VDVTVTFTIRNTDSQAYIYVATVQIGSTDSMIDIELDPYESKAISHTLTPDTAGFYEVMVDGLTGNFTAAKPSTWDKIPGFPHKSITMGLIYAILVLWFSSRAHRSRSRSKHTYQT